jgi:hypothetical protein
MDMNITETMQNIVSQLATVTETVNGGQILDNKVTFNLNEFDGSDKNFIKLQVLLDGPTLTNEKNHIEAVFPHKNRDDLLGFIALKVKNPEEALAQFKQILEGMGVGEDMVAQFGALVYKTYENEILIGFEPNEGIAGLVSPFLPNLTFMKGTGNEEIFAELSGTANHTFAEAMDDSPLFTHFLKGLKGEAKSRLYH